MKNKMGAKNIILIGALAVVTVFSCWVIKVALNDNIRSSREIMLLSRNIGERNGKRVVWNEAVKNGYGVYAFERGHINFRWNIRAQKTSTESK